MKNRFHLAGLALGLISIVGGLCCAAQDAGLSAVRQRAEERGYRVREVRWDGVLRQRWAVLENVAHPERPYIAELTETPVAVLQAESRRAANELARATVAALPAVVIHVGEQVTVWRAEGNVRIQMAAVAEGNSAVGGRLTLRVKGAGVFGDAGFQVTGIVRGPGSVEME